MLRIFAFFAVFFLSMGNAMAYDEPGYKIVEKDGDIEIRTYAPTTIAEVTVAADERDDAANDAFMILFRYIDGQNVSKTSIPMTVPVTQQPSPQKIPMTVPVTQERTAENGWTMAFFMPNDMAFEDVPQPTDSRIQIKQLPEQTYAVIRFSGFFSDKNIDKHDKILREHLDRRNIAYSEPRITAAYNAPFTPWFLRRNEVLYRLGGDTTPARPARP